MTRGVSVPSDASASTGKRVASAVPLAGQPRKVSRMNDVPASVATQWPVGPAYTEWVGASGVGAWVAYKLGTAEWFIDQLERVGDMVGYNRYVGVEMAMDGALAALCGGFDAAVGGLIGAVDKY